MDPFATSHLSDDALAEGRLHMRAVLMLAPYLTSANVDELVAAATHKSRFEIQELLAERFPQPDVPEQLRPVDPFPLAMAAAPQFQGLSCQLAPEQVGMTVPEHSAPAPTGAQSKLEVTTDQGSTQPYAPATRSELRPIAPERYAFQSTFDREIHDLLRDVRALLSHEIPTGEAVLVLKYALKLTKAELLKRKHGVTDRPGHSRGSASARTIPREVRRAVWARDGGQCAFVSENGRRCEARANLEYDHIEPVARGGRATIENVRLLCRAHNRYAAERAFGSEFVERKLAEARNR